MQVVVFVEHRLIGEFEPGFLQHGGGRAPVVHDAEDTVILTPPQDGVFMVFQLAEGYVPPRWPPADGEQRAMVHFDFEVADLDAATHDALALGARLAEFQPRANVRVLLDPAGHPFCLCRDDGADLTID